MFLSVYQDLLSTASQSILLLNFAQNQKSFANKDFVIFADDDYSYYIVWGDLEYSSTNDLILADDIEYAHYYRASSSGYNTYYNLDVGTDTILQLDLDNHMVVSNLDNVGYASVLYEEYQFYNNMSSFVLFGISFLFGIMIVMFRLRS